MDAPIEAKLSGVQFYRLGHSQRCLAGFVLMLFLLLAAGRVCLRKRSRFSGRVVDPEGNALPNASIEIVGQDQVLAHAISGPDGQFAVKLSSVRRIRHQS